MDDDSLSTLQPLSHNTARLTLLYYYFDDKYLDELHSVVPPVQTFTAQTCFATSIKSPYKFSTYTFSKNGVSLWNLLPKNRYCEKQTPERYNLNL